MIERLILSSFRGIRKGVIKDMGKINLLVGPNNSGKTAILEALYWLSVSGRACGLDADTLSELKDEDGLSRRGRDAFVPIGEDLLGFPPCPRIWKRHGKLESWEEAPGSAGAGALTYNIPHLMEDDPFKTFKLISPPAEGIRDTEKFDEDTLKTIGVFALDDPEGMSDVLAHYLPDLYPNEFSSENMHRRFAFTWYPDFIHWGKSLGAWGAEGTVADADCVLFFDFHATGDQFRPAFGSAIHNVIDWRDQLTDLFGAVFDNAVGTGDFRVEIGQLHLPSPLIEGAVEIKGKGTIPIDDFGDGARHAFNVLAGLVLLVDRCKDGREGIFLWEDPEIFMHSKSLCRLIREVLEIVKDKPIQVFISTQSLDVLAYMATMMEDEICNRNDVRTYTLGLGDDGVLDASKFRGRELNDWLRSGYDPRLLDVSKDNRVLIWHLKAEDEGELLW